MKSVNEIHVFLNNLDHEAVRDYKEEALHIYNNQGKMNIADIMHYWNLRFLGGKRSSFTSALAIHRFLWYRSNSQVSK